jgi:hypothetical protein
MTIDNEHQFQITLAHLKNFSDAAYHVALNKDQRGDVNPILKKAEFDAVCSKVRDFQDQLSAYLAQWAIQELGNSIDGKGIITNYKKDDT